jgi:hypothetical protein
VGSNERSIGSQLVDALSFGCLFVDIHLQLSRQIEDIMMNHKRNENRTVYASVRLELGWRRSFE